MLLDSRSSDEMRTTCILYRIVRSSATELSSLSEKKQRNVGQNKMFLRQARQLNTWLYEMFREFVFANLRQWLAPCLSAVPLRAPELKFHRFYRL